jgi:hypothetical protein
MIKACENCPKIKDCKGPCKELDEKLVVPGFDTKGELLEYEKRKFDSLDQLEDKDEGDPKAYPLKIDVGLKYSADTDLEIDWFRTPVQPVSTDLDQAENKILTDAIGWSISAGNPKLRRRFNAFLKCSKIVDIAKTANTTTQNIQKQFQSVIRRTHQIIKKGRQKHDYDPSPLQFKIKIRT